MPIRLSTNTHALLQPILTDTTKASTKKNDLATLLITATARVSTPPSPHPHSTLHITQAKHQQHTLRALTRAEIKTKQRQHHPTNTSHIMNPGISNPTPRIRHVIHVIDAKLHTLRARYEIAA